MHTKMAGQFQLADLVSQTIEGARTKLAAAEGRREKTASAKKTVKETEKVASAVIDSTSTDEVTKLASALIEMGEKLASDKVELGGEKAQGGEVIKTMAPVGGSQPYKHDKAKTAPKNGVEGGVKAAPDGGSASTLNMDDHGKKAPAAYPKKGVMKTAGDTVREKMEAQKSQKGVSDALDFLLGKIAESTQGGEVLSDDKAGNNPKPESGGSNAARKAIASNQAVINMKKVDGKVAPKKDLAQVLSEPAQSKATDSKVHENLRNASKGGVKIAAATALLQKIAEGGCTCEGKGECKYCKLKKSVEKKADEKKAE